jgi:catechol 2,3-dioxygenase-like lactoylglutathione lyase family enzyme
MFTDSNVTLMVADMDRAVAFYTETLGFTLARRFGDHWAEVQTPGVKIGLHPSKGSPKTSTPSHMSIGLRVEDIDAAMKQLTEKGIAFKPGNDKGSRQAFFNDPDGTPLYLIEIKFG